MRDDHANRLGERLFLPGQLLGWEFRNPETAEGSVVGDVPGNLLSGELRPEFGPRRIFPYLYQEPRWSAPPKPHHAFVPFAPLIGSGSVGRGLAIILACFGMNLLGLGSIFVLIGLLVAAGLAPWPWIFNQMKIRSAKNAYRQQLSEWGRRYNAAHARWLEDKRRWDEAEQRRLDSLDLWFPVEISRPNARLDVIGGRSDWWALTAVVGTSLLAAQKRVLLVDLTESDIAGTLMEVVAPKGIDVVRQSFPADLDAADLLRDMSAQDVGSLIAGLMDDLRGGGGDRERRQFDADIVRRVVDALSPGAVTLDRIVAALAFVQEPGLVSAELRSTDKEQLRRLIDYLGDDPLRKNQTDAVRRSLEEITAGASGNAHNLSGHFWAHSGLWVIETADSDHHRRESMDALLAQIVLKRIRALSKNQIDNGALILAGVDRLTLTTLEQTAKAAQQAGLLLILMAEHLRDDLVQLVGGNNSATAIMRLGNHQEAAAAAQYVGSAYRWMATARSRESGRSHSESEGSAESVNSSRSHSQGRSRSSNHTPFVDFPRFTYEHHHESSAVQGASQETNRGTVDARSYSHAQTDSRVHEFIVEPREIQHLESKAFILIDAENPDREVVVASCDPEVAFLPRVARRRILDDATRPEPFQVFEPPARAGSAS